MECFTCGGDHRARDCDQQPAPSPRAGVSLPAVRAENHEEHMSRIHGYVQLWQDGKITVHQKRNAIAEENIQWYEGAMHRGGISLTTRS